MLKKDHPTESSGVSLGELLKATKIFVARGKASRNCKSAKRLAPSIKPLPETECNQLISLFDAGKFLELESRTLTLIDQYPDSGFAWKVLGASLRAQGKNALQALHRARVLLPDDAEAHSNLGNGLRDLGKLNMALVSYQSALTIQPDYALAYSNLGILLRDLGQADNAALACRRALEVSPGIAEVHFNLGNALHDLGQIDEAMVSYRRALENKPSYAEAHNNLGNVLQIRLELAHAVASYRRALAINPTYADANSNLANALRDLGQIDDAVIIFHRALVLKPDYADAHNNLGTALADLGRRDKAVASYRRALEIKPDYAEAHVSMGNTLLDLGQCDSALASYHRALEIRPAYAEAHSNLGIGLRDLGQLDLAVASCRRAMQIKPNYAEAKYNSGWLLLQQGRLEEGWKLYEARNDAAMRKHFSFASIKTFPQWQGQAISGKSLLVLNEQGLGDLIQFCRYLPILKKRGASHITLVCQDLLKPLLERCLVADRILNVAQTGNIQAHDYWCFALSCPFLCDTTLNTIPGTTPYLYADEKRKQAMARQLSQISGLKVGVCWQGSKTYSKDAERSPGLEPFRKLFGLPGVRFFSLQVGCRQQFLSVAGTTGFDLDHEIDATSPPFEETAALIMNLDLVITIDSAIAHLAGALGKTTWVVLPYVADWRWMTERADSPWYPTTRLFRQVIRGNWDELFERVAQCLQAVAAGKSPVLWPII